MKFLIPRISRLAILLLLTFGCWTWVVAAQSFDDQLAQAKALFKAGKLDEAQAAAQAAAQLDPKRFEAPATLALILHEANKPDDARAALDAAAKLAPPDKQEQVQRMAQLLGAKRESTPANPAELTGAARRKYDTLLVIIEEADKAGQDAERKKLLREFLDKSGPFLKEHPDHLKLWALRASAALDLELERETREADRELARLRADELEEPGMRQLLVRLERKGWLGSGLAEMDRRAEEERQARERARQAELTRKAEEERRAKEQRAAEEAKRQEVEGENRRKQAAQSKLIAERTQRLESLRKQLVGTYVPVGTEGDGHKYVFKPDGTVEFLFKEAILDWYKTECSGRIAGVNGSEDRLVIEFTGTQRSPAGRGKVFKLGLTLHDDGTFTDHWQNSHARYKKK